MDLSYWKQLNSKIDYVPTRKQFFNRYLYKLVMEVPCARLINQSDDIAVALNRKLQFQRFPNYGGSWNSSLNQQSQLANASVEQLDIVRSIKHDYKDTIKIRTEEPWVQFYANTEEELKIIATRFNSTCNTRLISISAPENDEQARLLASGNIIVRKGNGFNYKVFIRDGVYSKEVKEQILNYLTNLGSDVQLPNSTVKHLSGSLTYIWGVYFYVNDSSALTFLSLIHPRAVRKIHKLVHIDE